MRLIASSASGTLGEKPVGALDQHAAEIEGLRGKPQHAVAGLQHLSPHVVERVGEERQGARVLDRILRRALRDDVDELFALETRPEQFRRPAHHLAQAVLAERRHVDLQAGLEQRLVALQRPKKVGAHAHHHAQARVGERLGKEFGEAPPLLSLSGARVKLLALIDIEEEGRRLGLAEFLAAALGGVDQMGERRLALQELDPPMLPLDALRVGRLELPSLEETFDQRLDRLGAGLERQKAPLPAVLKDRRPGVGRARVAGPGLTLERGEDAGLRQRGFAHAGIADQHRQPALRGERVERLDRFPSPAEEIVAVLLLHRLEAAIGRRMAPQLGRGRAAAGGAVEDARDVLFGGRIGRDDPVQLPQERQAGRGLPFERGRR